MAVSSEHRPLDGSLPYELIFKTPFPSLKLYILIGILSLSALSIGLLIYLCIRLSWTSEKGEILAKETNSRASSGPSYEVFLSFRGADTRHKFTDFLYRDMVDAGILVFRDAESLHVGKRIGDELLQAIENSKIYIPIFSKNYASSHWCLRELAYMIECTSKSNGNKEILPIFLDVELEDVKLKTKLYSTALSKHQKKFCTKEVESWKKALIEVDQIKGWNWKNNESQGHLVRSVIRTVSVKLKVAHEKVTEHLVGVDDRVEAIIKMLDMGSDSVRFLGIHGMGGVGKTTLAQVVFNTLSSSFEQCCFIADVRESSKGNDGPVNLQKQLLSKLLGSHSIDEIYHVNDGIKMIEKGLLRNKKVLIVLDDVDEKEQLKSLAEKDNWFCSGSRIIITTRDKSVLTEGPNVSTYEVCELEFDLALKLFSRHAFNRDSPPDHRVFLSKKIVHTLGKLPLALKITGSFLVGKSEELWIDTWEKLQEAPPKDVQRKLMITYERLDPTEREIFLDIACFFVNEDITYPLYMWDDCKYHPHVAIDVLVLMSLIKIKEDRTFWMHDQVRDLGREIVRQENFKHLGKRSRVWKCEEALGIVKSKEGSRKIEALSIANLGSCHLYRHETLTHDGFANLQNLRFFRGYNVSLVGDFNNLLTSLRWLYWQNCPSKFEATNFHPTNLVVLKLSCSYISEEWIGWDQIREARKLKILDLSYCHCLKRIPDLSTWVYLERLVLEGCDNLIEIDHSIVKLKRLAILNLDGCESLRELPEEIGCLQALTNFVMSPSKEKFKWPVISKRPSLKLPYSIGGLVKLTLLDLSRCIYIKELPDSVGKLQSLVELNLSSTSIDHLPDSIGNLKQLKVLRMSKMREITKLPSAIGLVEKLEELDARGCGNLSGEIPKEIGRLSRLKILDLSNTRISGLLTTVSHLSNLQTLKLGKCPELNQLPELPPTLPVGMDALSQLKTLKLSCKNVQFLSQLPSSLRELRLRDLATARSPDFSNLKDLSIMKFYQCSLEFSSIFDAESEELRMECCELRKLDPPLPLEMRRLRLLKIHYCEFLPEVLDLSCMKNLCKVSLRFCLSLVEIRGLEELGSLCSLLVVGCLSLERMSDLSKLKELRELEVVRCRKLKSVQGLNHLGPLKKRTIFGNGGFRGENVNATSASAVISRSPVDGFDS